VSFPDTADTRCRQDRRATFLNCSSNPRTHDHAADGRLRPRCWANPVGCFRQSPPIETHSNRCCEALITFFSFPRYDQYARSPETLFVGSWGIRMDTFHRMRCGCLCSCNPIASTSARPRLPRYHHDTASSRSASRGALIVYAPTQSGMRPTAMWADG